MRAFNSTLAGFGTTVFEVMSRLAKEHQTINLGQGFPDQEGPAAMLDTLPTTAVLSAGSAHRRTHRDSLESYNLCHESSLSL